MPAPSGQRIETVDGRPDAELSQRLVDFWAAHGALSEAQARERLGQVVCVLFDEAGEVAGVNSAFAAIAPLVNRRFWLYRRFLAPGVGQQAEGPMLRAAHEELARRFADSPEEPVGVCVLIADPAVMERSQAAVWPGLGFLFAGYTPEGAQVRICYFEGAKI